MKKVTFIGMIAAAVLAGALSAFFVQRSFQPKPSFPFVQYNDKVPTHFTAYDKDHYPDLTYAAENAVQAVVSIEKTETIRRQSYDPFWDFFGIPQQGSQSAPQERRSGGSGVLISADGYIVSNNHVVENATELKITLHDDRTFTAKLIGSDPTTDIALLKIEGNNFPFLPFGNSDDLRLGEWVLAIGAPYSLSSTVTAGIISAKGRNLNIIEDNMRLESFIQTDAAVNPGNSGGPLVNTKGEIIGINTVIKSPTGSFTGYSFAVPSSFVMKVVTDLREYGVVQRALLGIMYQEINDYFLDQRGQETGIKEKGGIYVEEVTPGGAAEEAGVKKGDVLIEMNGVRINDQATLSEQIARYRPNDRVKISVKRGNEVKQFDVTFRNKVGKTELLTKDTYDLRKELGGEFAELDDKTKQQMNLNHGVRITGVRTGSFLDRAGIPRGSVLTEIDGKAIRSTGDLDGFDKRISRIKIRYPDGSDVTYVLPE